MQGERLNGLDLFSGIGGLTLSLAPWVWPIAYCENEPYAQAVLLSRMRSGSLPTAPIWDDVCTLQKEVIKTRVEIIYGGFPCQDISVAGNGTGLEGKRSGLVSEIFRLVDELSPTFVFLENVPAIRTRGAERVVKELASRGYDCRWDVVSAAEVGAPHLRKRWFLLAAHAERLKLWEQQRRSGGTRRDGLAVPRDNGQAQSVADSDGVGCRARGTGSKIRERGQDSIGLGSGIESEEGISQSSVRRVVDGVPERLDEIESGDGSLAEGIWESEWEGVERVILKLPYRVARVKALGNSVVPAQAREAFERLMGLSD